MEDLFAIVSLFAFAGIFKWLTQAFRPEYWPASFGFTYPVMVKGFIVISLSSVLVGIYYPLIPLSENQVLYVCSAEAQVIAAIYALTLTGFIFHSDQVNKLVMQDPTKEAAVEVLRASSYREIMLLSFFAIASILSALLTIVVHDLNIRTPYLIAINLSGAFFVGSLLLTAHFVLSKVNPDMLGLASALYKKNVEKNATEGGVLPAQDEAEALNESFRAPFDDQVSVEDGSKDSETEPVDLEVSGEGAVGDNFDVSHLPPELAKEAQNFYVFHRELQIIFVLLDKYRQGVRQRKRSGQQIPLRPSAVMAQVMELAGRGIISQRLQRSLLSVFGYRNALVHSVDKKVPANVVQLAQRTRRDLEAALAELGITLG